MAAARMVLQRMGVDPADLITDPADRPPVPTFDAYIPEVEKAVSPGTAKTYSSYWNRIRTEWGPRTLLEPTATEIKQFEEEIKANAVQRRNSRGGRGTAENFIAALRCIYRHAEDGELVKPDENPARRTAKPRRQGSNRHALSADQMSEINFYAATTGDDPELDTLLLRPHTESACRTGGALALRPRALNEDQCLIYLREKDGTARWQPVSRSLMAALLDHAETRGSAGNRGGQLLRYRNGNPITHRRYDQCALLYANVVLRAEEIRRDREIAEAAPGDAMLDLAIPTLGQEERLDDLLAGYGSGADRDVIRAW